MSESSTPAGWYEQVDGTERFWTGSQWSTEVRPAPSATVQWSAVQSGAVVPAPYTAASQRNPAPGYPQPYVAQGYAPQVAPKSPGLALLGSFFVPGLGQLMNGDAGKGVLMFCLYVVSILLTFVLIGFVLAPAVWIWGMVDAYGGAQRWNAQRGIVS